MADYSASEPRFIIPGRLLLPAGLNPSYGLVWKVDGSLAIVYLPDTTQTQTLLLSADGTTVTVPTLVATTFSPGTISGGSTISSSTSMGLVGSNGQVFKFERLTELVSVGTGLTTKATTIQIPANCLVMAIPVRVTVLPGGTSTMTVTATTSTTEFQTGASIATAANTTDEGIKNCPKNLAGTAAQTVTFTFNTATNNTLGRIRIDIFYLSITPATS